MAFNRAPRVPDRNGDAALAPAGWRILSEKPMIAKMTRPRSSRRQVAVAALLGATILLGPGCMSAYHTVGAGATGGEMASDSQWYALWGFVPMGGAPDFRTVAGDQTNYKVYNGFTTWDVVLNFFTGWLGFYRASIIVEF
jgi:hypothetical protein